MKPQFALEGTYVPDNLIAGELEIETEEVTIITGAALTRGAVLGKLTRDTVGAVTADAGNTGTGAAAGAATVGASAQVGTYLLECIVAATTFAVFTPKGERLADLTVGVAYAGPHVNLTIAAGGVPFIVTDKFTIAVSGSGKYKLAAAAAVDGSADPVAILAQDTDAALADKKAVAFLTGEFAQEKLSFGAGHTAATVKAPLRELGIFLKSTVAA